MAKNVLGDNPFDTNNAKKRSKTRPSPSQVKVRDRGSLQSKGAGKKGWTDDGSLSRSSVTPTPPAARTLTKPRSGTTHEQPPREEAASAQPSGRAPIEGEKQAWERPASFEPAPPLSFPTTLNAQPIEDGAAARRAARATSTQKSPPAMAEASPVVGQGVDDRAPDEKQTGSLAEEIRRIEQRLIRKQTSQPMSQRSPSLGSFLDRVGQLFDSQTYRRWISDLKMRHHADAVDEFGFDPIYAESWRPWLEFLYHSYWRVETSGVENLPDQGRAIIVANHAGTLPYDGAMIMHAMRYDHPAHRNVRPLVEDFLFHFPFLGPILNRIGFVRACPENADRLLEHEQIIAIFPEGEKGIGKLYRHRYQLQRFGRGGFIKLALQTKAPIIPTAVIGSEEVHPMLGKVTWLANYMGIPFVPLTPTFPWLGPVGAIPLPAKWQIRFGEPIDLAARFGSEAVNDRILVNQLTEEVRSTIQHLVDETLLSRKSILFG